MTNLYRIKAFSMMAWWIACSIFVWPLAAVSLAVTLLPLGFVLTIFEPAYGSPAYQYYEFVMLMIVAPIFGAVIGVSMNLLQNWVLRTKLYWAAYDWRKWTIMGSIVGAYAVLLAAYAADFLISGYHNWAMVLAMPVFVTVISIFQYIPLRDAVKDAWLWVMGNAVGGIVFSGLLANNFSTSYYNRTSELQQVGAMILAPLILGAITGYVMLFLFEKKLLPMQPVPVPIPVEDPNRPKSIWDDAI